MATSYCLAASSASFSNSQQVQLSTCDPATANSAAAQWKYPPIGSFGSWVIGGSGAGCANATIGPIGIPLTSATCSGYCLDATAAANCYAGTTSSSSCPNSQTACGACSGNGAQLYSCNLNQVYVSNFWVFRPLSYYCAPGFYGAQGIVSAACTACPSGTWSSPYSLSGGNCTACTPFTGAVAGSYVAQLCGSGSVIFGNCTASCSANFSLTQPCVSGTGSAVGHPGTCGPTPLAAGLLQTQHDMSCLDGAGRVAVGGVPVMNTNCGTGTSQTFFGAGGNGNTWLIWILRADGSIQSNPGAATGSALASMLAATSGNGLCLDVGTSSIVGGSLVYMNDCGRYNPAANPRQLWGYPPSAPIISGNGSTFTPNTWFTNIIAAGVNSSAYAFDSGGPTPDLNLIAGAGPSGIANGYQAWTLMGGCQVRALVWGGGWRKALTLIG